mmetsp:Transcript_160309/g.514385  ORF Transcript_160309/g.514385 Transcript_160309/m.514385 type:complete len:262 (+) Transcript_160309:640-1425(+)
MEGCRAPHGVSRQHAVAKVGDVLVDTKLLHHPLSPFHDLLWTGIKQMRIEVALQGLVRTISSRPCRRGRPAGADNVEIAVVGPCDLAVLREDGHQGLRPLTLDLGGNVLEVRDTKLLVDAGWHLSTIRVEDRQQRCTGVELVDQVLHNDVAQARHQLLGLLWVKVEPLLGSVEAGDCATLDHVAHERPRSTAEADNRHIVVTALAGPKDGVEHIAEGRRDIWFHVELGQIRRGLDCELELRTLGRLHVARHAHRDGDHQDV